MKAVIATAPAVHRPESDSPSPSDLRSLALQALIRALESDDEKVSVRAAQVVLQHLVRQSVAPPVQKAMLIAIQYGDDPGAEPPPWSVRGDEQPRPLQGGGLRTTLGQDGNGEDGRD